MDATPTGPVTAVPAAPPADAARHFRARLAFETDPADLAAHLRDGPDDVVVVDTRSPEAYAAGHLPGAVNLPHATIDAAALGALPPDALVVTYCWGPACNAATKGAARIAALGRAVKEMPGGIAAWTAEGFAVTTGAPTRGPGPRKGRPGRRASG
ncbi:rhodanese-like domain-containing protein [Iamia majanohamensis]|uniref:Rhodanese-like domain-containing protein n=1 Tax=Iamia majanohamensis TaxID=467976 RepID=A0AAE9Y5B1_9ACTN|nr:rhodanese-like domain-containing protein [Iamia majanohamensis]WCO65641.1 rhodanese-like domain-containing protein [Iamia majanohamensis]